MTNRLRVQDDHGKPKFRKFTDSTWARRVEESHDDTVIDHDRTTVSAVSYCSTELHGVTSTCTRVGDFHEIRYAPRNLRNAAASFYLGEGLSQRLNSKRNLYLHTVKFWTYRWLTTSPGNEIDTWSGTHDLTMSAILQPNQGNETTNHGQAGPRTMLLEAGFHSRQDYFSFCPKGYTAKWLDTWNP